MAGNEKEQVAGFMDQLAGQGFEGMGAGDYAIPFLKILQPLSPECIEGGESYVPGAKAGVFFNTLTKRIYGAEIQVIPLKYESIWLAWAPNRGGLKGRYEPNSIDVTGDPFTGMKDKDGNDVVENMVFYVVCADHKEDGPLVFPLASSGMRHGKNWNSQIMLTKLPSGKRAPYFGAVWKLGPLVLNKNDQGTWYQLGTKNTNVSFVRWITEPEYIEHVGEQRKLLAGPVKVDFQQIEGHSSERAAGDATEY